MVTRSFADTQEVLAARWPTSAVSRDAATRWTGAAIDSRALRGGELFFALPGQRVDGHDFVADALRRGAAGAVVARPVSLPAPLDDRPLLLVDDVVEALHRVTVWVRAGWRGKVVGITGSSGKTTTKDLLAAMLGRAGSVAKSPGNFNNLLGFPLTLLNADEDADWLVAEMGISEPGEMARLTRLVRPHVAIITNVREAHLEFFGTRHAIAEEKVSIVEGLEPGGVLIIPAGDDEIERLAAAHVGRVVRFATGGDARANASADVHASDVEPLPGGGSRFRVAAGGAFAPVELALFGRHNIDNTLAAAAAAFAVGVPVAALATAASTVAPASEAHRGVVRRIPAAGGEALLVDDCYNSNPSALARALEATAQLPALRRWAVLGDMRELGADGPRWHREAGERAAELGFEPIAAVGELARELAVGAGAAAHWFPDAASAASWAPSQVRDRDVVLVKGSRGVGLEAVVNAFDAAAGEH